MAPQANSRRPMARAGSPFVNGSARINRRDIATADVIGANAAATAIATTWAKIMALRDEPRKAERTNITDGIARASMRSHKTAANEMGRVASAIAAATAPEATTPAISGT